MTDHPKRTTKRENNTDRGFFATLLISFVRDIVKFIIAFAVGTGGGAIFCWYYNIPLIFSLLGGILAIGLALAIYSDGLFS